MRNMADDDVVELTSAPFFNCGEKVRAKYTIRNDGTYAGKQVGDILAKKGEIGYVISIGTFLQKFYVYGVEFVRTGHRVGMRRKELALLLANEDAEERPLPGGNCR
ncbi:nitrogen fixation protein NifZ [Bradyrhizobium sp. Cp5.3]|uniref:nitrogen fixation protein NifZ n=1 Tax=Bradyrhizobium sp. Cp5.3 TaxID=443598 RepID=UPI000413E735|nr:nitrogen fixation protein NifZ [Bradyrhizobium sp. Cp5.3]